MFFRVFYLQVELFHNIPFPRTLVGQDLYLYTCGKLEIHGLDLLNYKKLVTLDLKDNKCVSSCGYFYGVLRKTNGTYKKHLF